MRQKLSKAVLDAAQPQSQRYLLLDTRTVGLALKVEPSGKKTFVFEYRMLGRTSQRCTIGRFGEPWTLDMARKEAGRLRGLVDQGIDPLEEHRKARQEAAEADTLDDLMAATLEHLEKLGRRASTLKEYRRIYSVYVAKSLGRRKVEVVTSGDVAKLHARLAHIPYQANRVLAVLSRAFTLAQRWGLRPAGSNPVQFLEHYKEARRGEKKGAMLTPEQIGRLLAVLDEESARGEDPFGVAALRLAFWTGWRLKSEVLRLRWQDLDLAGGFARLLATKTEEEAYRALPDEALAVLRGLPRIEGSPWVFPGRDPMRHRTAVRWLWLKVRKRAGLVELEDLGDFRVHDLRHNAVSWDVSRGVSLKVAGASVGHKSQQSTEVYAHFLPNHLREAANARSQAMREATAKLTAGGEAQLSESD